MARYEITHEDGRFHTKTEHGEAELLYRIDGRRMEVYRTFVPEEDRHQGIAKALMDMAVAFAEERGLEVVPSCEYAHAYMNERAKGGEAGTVGAPQ